MITNKPTKFVVNLEDGDNGEDLREVIYNNDLEYIEVRIVDGALHFGDFSDDE